MEGPCRCGAEHAPAPVALPENPSWFRRTLGRYSAPAGVVECCYPYFGLDGRPIHRTVRYRDPKEFRQERYVGGQWRPGLRGVTTVLYRLPQLVSSAHTSPVFLCFSSDTEILTERGWATFPSLSDQDTVAQYDPQSELISFVQPNHRQNLEFDGSLVHLASEFCDLLVTPDHRMLVKYRQCLPKVVSASEVKSSMCIPVSGIANGGLRGPSAAQARFLTAYAADGRWEPRGNWITFNIKKPRKHQRLRALLQSLSIEWTERKYPSTPGWIQFVLDKEAVPWVREFMPEKRWDWDVLRWPLATREAILDEIGKWDGDSQSPTSRRFFSADKQAADIVSAAAALTGWGATVRIDNRTDRPEQNVQYVVNLNGRRWRGFGYTPSESIEYKGKVHCCTVQSGFVVVRRNGKVSIAGNCEGEKDAERLASLGLVATCAPSGCAWKLHYAQWLNDRDVTILQDNDEAGRRRAERLFSQLLSVCTGVRIIAFEYMNEGADVSDWLDAGGTVSELTRHAGRSLRGAAV